MMMAVQMPVHPRDDPPEERSVKRGRWSPEEHAVFLKWYDKYGRNWKRIATFIQGRNHIQVRTHAQKYLKKLERQRSKQDLEIYNPPAPFLEMYVPTHDNLGLNRAEAFPEVLDIIAPLAGFDYDPLPSSFDDEYESVYSEEGGDAGMYGQSNPVLEQPEHFQTPPICVNKSPPPRFQPQKEKSRLSPPRFVGETLSRDLKFSVEPLNPLKRKRSNFLEQNSGLYAERDHQVTPNNGDPFLPTGTDMYQ